MSESITFFYSIRPLIIQKDRQQFDVKNLDEKGLRRLGYGCLMIVDNRARVYIVIETQVLDYADQLMGVISEIDRGNFETFAVSPDFYSNSLDFSYDPQSKMIEVSEVNSRSFRIKFKYRSFKSSLKNFYNELLEDLMISYPELIDNAAFQLLRRRCAD